MKNVLLFFALLLNVAAFSQKLNGVQQNKVDQLFKNKKVVYFKFDVNSTQEVPALAKVISIDKGQGRTVFAHADKKQFSSFIVKNYAYTIVTSPRAKPKAKSSKGQGK